VQPPFTESDRRVLTDLARVEERHATQRVEVSFTTDT
jgi:hypothetical protein